MAPAILPSGPPEVEEAESLGTTMAPNSDLFPVRNASPPTRPSALSRLLAQASQSETVKPPSPPPSGPSLPTAPTPGVKLRTFEEFSEAFSEAPKTFDPAPQPIPTAIPTPIPTTSQLIASPPSGLDLIPAAGPGPGSLSDAPSSLSRSQASSSDEVTPPVPASVPPPTSTPMSIPPTSPVPASLASPVRPQSRQSRVSFSRPSRAFPTGAPLAKASPTTALSELPSVVGSPFIESPTNASLHISGSPQPQQQSQPQPPASRARSGSRTPRLAPTVEDADYDPNSTPVGTLTGRRRTTSYHVPRASPLGPAPDSAGPSQTSGSLLKPSSGLSGIMSWGASLGRRRQTELALPAVSSEGAVVEVTREDASTKTKESRASELLRRF
jgi:hypothetical protein